VAVSSMLDRDLKSRKSAFSVTLVLFNGH